MIREEMVRKKTEQLTLLMSEEIVKGGGKMDIEKALELFSGPWDPQIYIFDKEKNVIMRSPKARDSSNIPHQDIVEKTLKGESLSGLILSERLIYYTRPIVNDGKTVGIIYVNLPVNIPLRNRFRALAPLLKAVALIAFLSIFVSAFMARKIIHPLEEMTETARKLGEGDLGARVKKQYFSEETQVMGEALNRMAEKLQSTLEALDADRKRLKHMERMRRDLIASISHEIRTPLSTIQGCSEAIQDGVVTGADAKRYIDVIHKEVNYLNRLISDLLELEKLEAKAVVLQREFVSVKELFGEIAEIKQLELAKSGIIPEFSGEDVPVYVDRDKLKEVLSNLLENTIRYCPHKTKVIVSARKEEKRVLIIFEDNGPGVSDDDRARLFEHFYRVEKSRSKSRGGYGLGLAIVKNIIQIHGGTVDAENVEGGGLRFIVAIPEKQE